MSFFLDCWAKNQSWTWAAAQEPRHWKWKGGVLTDKHEADADARCFSNPHAHSYNSGFEAKEPKCMTKLFIIRIGFIFSVPLHFDKDQKSVDSHRDFF